MNRQILRAAAVAIVLLAPLPLAAQAAPDAPPPAAAEPVPVPATDAPASSAATDAPMPAAIEGAGSAEPAGVDRATLPHDLSPAGMFRNADRVVKSVLILLAAASVATWAIFLAKTLELSGFRRSARRLGERVGRAEALEEAEDMVGRGRSAGAALVRAAAEEVELSAGLPAEGIKERVASRLERIEARTAREMGRGTGILATVGSIAPFVGLFGTVWGIMNSFIGISQANTTNLAVVAPGIAEALFATAIGLVAAIPSVVFYNVFARMIAGNRAALADVSAATLRLVSRDLDRATGRAAHRLAAE